MKLYVLRGQLKTQSACKMLERTVAVSPPH